MPLGVRSNAEWNSDCQKAYGDTEPDAPTTPTDTAMRPRSPVLVGYALIGAALLTAMAATALPAQAGRAFFDEGVRLMRANEPSKAEKEFERAIRAEPLVAEYHLWLGNAVGEQAQEASVLRQPFMARRIKAEFERAVELDPQLVAAREGLLNYYLAAPGVMGGSLEKAKQQAAEIAKLDAFAGHMAAAQISWHGKDTVATVRDWRAAIALRPDSAAPVASLAQRLQAWGRNADAAALYQEHLARQPNSVPVRFQSARLSAITGEGLPRAEGYLRAIIADESWTPGGWFPPRAAVHARLGDVLRKQGRTAEARASYETALAMDKNSQIAKDGLAALR
jgi:tetratricopeptide (TPR) repeat protein